MYITPFKEVMHEPWASTYSVISNEVSNRVSPSLVIKIGSLFGKKVFKIIILRSPLEGVDCVGCVNVLEVCSVVDELI